MDEEIAEDDGRGDDGFEFRIPASSKSLPTEDRMGFLELLSKEECLPLTIGHGLIDREPTQEL